jgi:hypothetical protein
VNHSFVVSPWNVISPTWLKRSIAWKKPETGRKFIAKPPAILILRHIENWTAPA